MAAANTTKEAKNSVSFMLLSVLLPCYQMCTLSNPDLFNRLQRVPNCLQWTRDCTACECSLKGIVHSLVKGTQKMKIESGDWELFVALRVRDSVTVCERESEV